MHDSMNQNGYATVFWLNPQFVSTINQMLTICGDFLVERVDNNNRLSKQCEMSTKCRQLKYASADTKRRIIWTYKCDIVLVKS